LPSYTPDNFYCPKETTQNSHNQERKHGISVDEILEASFPMCDGLTGFHQATTLLRHIDSEHRRTLCADDPEVICEQQKDMTL
jgi:hypothetical protein